MSNPNNGQPTSEVKPETKEQREARLNGAAKQSVTVPPQHAPKPTAPAPQRPRKANIVWRENKEFIHHLFRLHPEEMKKNVSYKKFDPKIELVLHEHFYHSVDMDGKAVKYCQAVGGHFHLIEFDFENPHPDGSPRAVCGPPLRFVDRRTHEGRIKQRIERVRYAQAYYDASDDDQSDEIDAPEDEGKELPIRWLEDEHTHTIEYMGSEMISPSKIAKIQEANKAAVVKMMGDRKPAEHGGSEGTGGESPEGDDGGEDGGSEGVGDTGATVTES